MFSFDEGTPPKIVPQSASVDSAISYRNRGVDAERTHRKIIYTIQNTEDVRELDTYWRDESLVIDAIFLDYPEFAQAITEAYEDHRIMLTGRFVPADRVSAEAETGAPDTAQSSPTAQTAHNGTDGKERKDNECIW